MPSSNYQIHYGITDSPFGKCVIAKSPTGICHLAFVNSDNDEKTALELQFRRPNACLTRDDSLALQLAPPIFNAPSTAPALDIKGTDFQMTVWRCLMTIPFGKTISYGDLASKAGYPRASRAVGTAVANNPIAYIIPCHRVIRADGTLGNYRWGAERKNAMIKHEQASPVY